MRKSPNQPIRFDPLKFRGLQIILYQVHQTFFHTFLLRVQGGSGGYIYSYTKIFTSPPTGLGPRLKKKVLCRLTSTAISSQSSRAVHDWFSSHTQRKPLVGAQLCPSPLPMATCAPLTGSGRQERCSSAARGGTS